MKGLINIRDAGGTKTRMGNGASVKAKGVGTLPVMVCNKEHKELYKATIKDIYIMPGSPFNLLSGGKLLQDGFKMSGDKDAIRLTKGKQELVFDIKIGTAKGMLYGIYLKRVGGETGMAGKDTITLSIKDAHEKLGHVDEEKIRQTAKELGWTLTKGKLLPCEECAQGKAKQKDIHTLEEPKEKATTVNGRVYLDISTLKNKDGPPPKQPNWRILVDELTGLKISHFFATKNGMVQPTCQLFLQWKQAGTEVKILRMDNAG